MEKEDIKIALSHASYAIDIESPKAVVEDANYVFIGQVRELLGTECLFGSSFPYTFYRVTVLENLKGNLEPGDVVLYKRGGIQENRAAIQIEELDFFLTLDNCYVFSAYAQSDGKLTESGYYANVPIPLAQASQETADLLAQIQETEVYQTYANAVREAVASDRSSEKLCAFDRDYKGEKGVIPNAQDDVDTYKNLLPLEPQPGTARTTDPTVKADPNAVLETHTPT